MAFGQQLGFWQVFRSCGMSIDLAKEQAVTGVQAMLGLTGSLVLLSSSGVPYNRL